MKIKSLLLIAFLTVLLSPTSSFACACCADAGEYSISMRKPISYEIDELKKIKFNSPNIFATPAFPEDIKGINPLSENYSLSAALMKNTWKFDFKDQSGKSGTLNLMMPATMLDYRVDIHDDKQGGGGPLLYKELRFKSRVQSGTGIFQKGIAPSTEYFLVLQGRGNNCMNASDFTHWRLEITGNRADYAFFGVLN